MIKIAQDNPPYKAQIYYQYVGSNIHESREFRGQGDFQIEIKPSRFYNWDNEVLIIKDLGISMERQVSFSIASGQVWVKQPNLEHPHGRFIVKSIHFENERDATIEGTLGVRQNPVDDLFLRNHYRIIIEIHERRSYESLYDHVRGLNHYPNLRHIQTLF